MTKDEGRRNDQMMKHEIGLGNNASLLIIRNSSFVIRHF